MKDICVGIDVGGSHVEVGLVDSSGKVLLTMESEINSQEITPTEIVTLIKNNATSMIDELKKSGSCRILAAGVGCPGQANGDILVAASNFPKFNNVPFVRLISDAFGGISVTLLNDADAAVSAEVWGNPEMYGKYDNIAMLTLGTGIGCGLIINGQLYQGSSGMVEAGHMIVTNSAQSRPCGCGQRGCVEAYSSAKSTVMRLQEMDLHDKNSSSTVLDGKDVFSRYLLNDFNAVKVVEETAEHLAVLSINLCRVIDPQIIVFGGGLSRAGTVLLDLIRKYVREKTWTVLPTDVKLTLAISDKGGVLGAALAAKQKANKLLLTQAPSKPPSSPSPSQESKQSSSKQEEQTADLITTNFNLGSFLLVNTAAIFLSNRSDSSYLKDLLLIGNVAVGIALLFKR